MLQDLFSQDFMPHGHCFRWVPEVLWLHVVSDSLIAIAYYSIPVALLYFARKRTDLSFKWIFLMFAVFILACGTTHIFNILTIWHPIYGWEGVVKFVTASASVATGIAIWPLIPRAVALPSASMWRTINAELEQEISKKNLVEEELRRSHQTLEQRVLQRTQELEQANSSLRREIAERERAQAELKTNLHELSRSNAELEQFGYIVSHDLREPLRMIGGFSELLRQRLESQLDDKTSELFGFIIQGVERMGALTTGLLSYSRVGANRGKPALVDCQLALNAALQNLQATIQESGAVVTADPLPQILAEELELTQIFQNLIGNAIKFRSQNSPRIKIGAKRVDGQVVFSVNDNGIGIEPAHAKKIFEIFKRLHTSGEYPGTGIGLSICKKIVEEQGGQIWVESQIGQGATFYFTFPDGGVA
jgi:signal transduction histidine kinase